MDPLPQTKLHPVLKVQNLSKHYDLVPAVCDLSFEVFPGEIIGVLGPNGAGKTTTIECILTLRSPDSGLIEIDGEEVRSNPIRSKQLLGAQLQSTKLPDAITPLQALDMAGSFYSKRLNSYELLDRFDLAAKAKSPFHTLSQGQQQKLSLALALVHKPKLILLDEPTAGLDPNVRNSLHQTLLELRAEGCAILLSTHLVLEAQKLCDRILFIDHGKLIAQGTTDQIIEQSSQLSTIKIQLSRVPDTFECSDIQGISSHGLQGQILTLQSEAPDTVIMALLEKLLRENVAINKLEITKPDLESAYLALTGRTWPESQQIVG